MSLRWSVHIRAYQVYILRAFALSVYLNFRLAATVLKPRKQHVFTLVFSIMKFGEVKQVLKTNHKAYSC